MTVLADSPAFSGFSVDDADRARRFYEETLGLRVTGMPVMGGLLRLHLALTATLGCTFAQGYYIARPMPAVELPRWLQEWAAIGMRDR
jgi:catechol 2,3-dioxygenase-like lactoylglutathione lyase family enzyme